MTSTQTAAPPAGVGVVGAGTMGLGIAYVFAVGGCTVTVVEPVAAQIGAMWREIDAALTAAVVRNKLTATEAETAREQVRVVDHVDELGMNLDLIVESVPEDADLKKQVLVRAERREPSVLATNTSSLSIDSLAANLSRPARFLGMHFFNPVWSLPLVELIQSSTTSQQTIELAQSAVESLGKQSIVVRDVPGFATSRLDMGAALEAMRMLEDRVATAADIDRAAVLAYRHPVGPLELSDIVGLDVRLDIARSLERTYGARFAAPQILVDKVAAGDLGKKTGRGFHDWSTKDPQSSRTPHPPPNRT